MKENENKSLLADQIIRNHMLWSMGAGLIWVPIVDFLAVSAIQLDLVRQLCATYDQDFKESQGKAVISALSTSSLSRLAARAVKFIPGIGTVLGGVTMSIMSGASSYAIGELFKKHFENGGTILDFDAKAFKSKYDELFEKGKEYAQQMKQKAKEENSSTDVSDESQNPTSKKPASKTRSALDQLRELSELKEKGILNEEEFNDFKKKILEI
jgi:uncharacterized protein (DUF697 family)